MFSSELQLSSATAKLFHLKQFAIYGVPLTRRLYSELDHHSPRQVQQLYFIPRFTTDIRHITGQGNPVTDALSHLEADAVQCEPASSTIDFQEMAKAQLTDPELQKLQSSNTTLTLA